MQKNKYTTFKKFCDECEEYFARRYESEATQETIQEVFDKCLDLSQKKILAKCIY